MITSNIEASAAVEREYVFGPFRFIPGQELLLHGEAPLRLGSRALGILAALVEHPGELITKEELIAKVWPTVVVDEGNLKVQIASLRRALGAAGDDGRYVVTLNGRGYRFVAPVTAISRKTAPPMVLASASTQAGTLQVPTRHTVSRLDVVAALLQALHQHRLVDIVGPGGIGKSTVMLAAAEAFVASADVEACFVDLSPLADGQFVAGAIAAALGLAIQPGEGVGALVALLRERRLLLVLDGCEHVIDEVAVLMNRIIAGTPGVRVLATSREPLRLAGEYVYRLAPFDYPASSAIGSAEALDHAAVQLFVLRAAESRTGYRLSDDDAPAVAEICRRLDGVALAIELAATRMDAFGAVELAALLDDRFRLLKRGRRTALARHRTLEAALDWSYEYLPEGEQALLCALSVFAGTFTLAAAIGLCEDTVSDRDAVVDGISALVAKSLLAADVSGPRVHYRLLDTTKAYALDKLELRGALDAMRRCHLAYQHTVFEQALVEWEERSGADWLASYGRNLDDVRAALAWAFSPDGDRALGVALTVAAIPLWMELSLLEEGRECINAALDEVDAGAMAGARDEMKLQAALAAATLYAHGPLPATNIAWSRLLELADARQDSEYQLMALWGMATYRSYLGQFQAVQELAARFGVLAAAKGDQAAMDGMQRLVGTALHFSGQQEAARSCLETMLERYPASPRRSSMARLQLDGRSAALGTLANVLWLRGYPDQAMQAVHAALKQAREVRHAASLMNAIATAGHPIMYFVGDLAAAEALSAELDDLLTRNALPLWQTLSRCIGATLRLRRGEEQALPLLREAVGKLQEGGFRLRLTCHWGTLACALGEHGRHAEALELVHSARSFFASGEERWFDAELLRIEGELREPEDPAAAASAYRQALDVAREQGALALELRAAMNLARLGIAQEQPDEGRRILAGVYERFSEGHATVDLVRARSLLGRTA